jgi:ABC-type antimicrobial peptide transport system permease subunit
LDIEIVGLVRDAKYSDVKQAIPPMYFRPYRQDADLGFVTFYVKTVTDPSPILRAIPALVTNLDANLPVEDLKTLEQQARESVLLDRVIGILSTAFAALATLLAAVGLYGVLAYTVAQRTREFGLRMALGANGGKVRGLVLRQVGLMTLIGSVVGILAAFGVGRAAQSILFGMEGFDPVVVALVTVLLAAVSIGAGYLPALRASKVDPMKALRYE